MKLEAKKSVTMKKEAKMSVNLVKKEGKDKIKVWVSLSLSITWARLGDRSVLVKVKIAFDARSCELEVVRVEVLLLLG